MWQTLAKARSDESRTDVMKNNAMQRATNAFNEKASRELSGLVENGHVEVGLEGALKERVGGGSPRVYPDCQHRNRHCFLSAGRSA